jgi:hypothetical protein
LYSISGKFFNDGPFMVKPVGFMYGINATQAQALVGTVQHVFKDFRAIGYNFPIWSLGTAELSWLMG